MKIAKLSKSKLEYLQSKARGKSQKAHIYAHVLECYLVIFESACDQGSDVIDWRPEIKEAIANGTLKLADGKP